jgi:hypothetical protein
MLRYPERVEVDDAFALFSESRVLRQLAAVTLQVSAPHPQVGEAYEFPLCGNGDFDVITRRSRRPDRPHVYYDENKKAVLEFFGRYRKAKMMARDAMMTQLKRRHAARTAKTQRMDEQRRAKRTYSQNQLMRDDTKIHRWMRSPGRFDVAGVDTRRAGARRPRERGGMYAGIERIPIPKGLEDL